METAESATPRPDDANETGQTGQTRKVGRTRALATAVIVAVIGLQAIAGFKLACPPRSIEWLAPLRVACPPALWPFTDYPMYSETFGPGAELPRYRVVGVAWDGARFTFEREALGVSHRRFREEFIRGLLHATPLRYQAVFEEWRAVRPDLAGVILFDEPIVLREDGSLDSKPERPLRNYRVDASGALVLVSAEPPR